MSLQNTTPTINAPVHRQGIKMDTVSSIRFLTPAEAEKAFAEVRNRLLDINNWNHLCGFSENRFQLTDSAGNPKYGLPKKGDLMSANLPAPPLETKTGYDWDKIEEIKILNEPYRSLVSIQVRPVADPKDKNAETAHFFSSSATNTFSAERKGLEITVSIRGRNEKLNTSISGWYNKLRNFIMGLSAWAGGSKIMWKMLVSAILYGKEQEPD